jgi:hypothetical protein
MELTVNTGGLLAAAASSDAAADGLKGVRAAPSTGRRPSSSGVSAMNSALAATRNRQYSRIATQADRLRVGSGSYASGDAAGADAISAVNM